MNENNGGRRVGRTRLRTTRPGISNYILDAQSFDGHGFRGYSQYVSVVNAYEPAYI